VKQPAIKWPKQVKVFGQIYMIEYMGKVPGNMVGECDHRKQRIRVRKVAIPVMAETLLHEIGHAIWYHGGLDDSESKTSWRDEERIVNIYTKGLVAVLHDNPAVAQAISKGLKIRWCGSKNLWEPGYGK
jgi:hypothetical protein